MSVCSFALASEAKGLASFGGRANAGDRSCVRRSSEQRSMDFSGGAEESSGMGLHWFAQITSGEAPLF